MPSKTTVFLLFLAIGLVACQAPATQRLPVGVPLPPAVLHNPEGVEAYSGPVRVHPARVVDSTLLARSVAGIVIASGLSGAEVRLFPNDFWREVIRADTTRRDGTVAWTDLPARDYSGYVRCAGYVQQLFRLRLTRGYVDTLRVDLELDKKLLLRGDSLHIIPHCWPPLDPSESRMLPDESPRPAGDLQRAPAAPTIGPARSGAWGSGSDTVPVRAE